MRQTVFFIILLLSCAVSAQKKDIEIEEERGESHIKLFAVNNTSEELELTFGIQVVGFTVSEIVPVKKILKPGLKEYLLTLTAPKGTNCEYQTSINYKKAKSISAQSSPTSGVKRMTGIQLNPAKMNVFTQDGCSRCEFVINFLEKSKIPYLELNTTIHQPNQELMFEQLAKAGFSGNNVQMPVIISKGNIDYNISNLSEYVKKIK